MAKNKSKKGKNHSSKNLKINTRIILTNTIAAVLVLILVAIISMAVRGTLPSVFNISRVDTKSYSMLNQLQWSQSVTSLADVLSKNGEDDSSQKEFTAITDSLEGIGSMIYIISEDGVYYSSENPDKIIELANSVTSVSLDRNMNYFGENGLVIVSHIAGNDKNYTVLIVNDNYTMENYNDRTVNQDITSILFGRTGLIIGLMVLIFVVAIFVISLISSKTISKPISKLAKGAEELTKGNFDYVIDYDSTNEIGQTVKSFNYMVEQMKRSIEERDTIEQSRKEMIAGVAHDLRTPLTSVKGYVEGLRDGIASTPEKQERYLQTIYSSTLDMERLLDELLTTSRLELGQIELERESININDFMRDCAEDLSVQMEKAGFDFVYNNPYAEEKIMVSLDTDRFGRVISNIVSNSIKYADKSRKGRVELELQSYSKSVIISLTDNGIGVSGENLSRIFETFYRADQARTRVREGSGIGLSVCKQIVELHGGHIWATSKQGEGLTVLISLEKNVGDYDE